MAVFISCRSKKKTKATNKEQDMALKIAGIEPVELGDRQCKPRLDADKRLRLRQIKLDTKSGTEKAIEVIASCFPDDEDFVADFLKNEAGPTDLQLIALYLQGGQQALDSYQRILDKLMAEATQNATNTITEGTDANN